MTIQWPDLKWPLEGRQMSSSAPVLTGGAEKGGYLSVVFFFNPPSNPLSRWVKDPGRVSFLVPISPLNFSPAAV
ncbi:hypothetical protein TNIN_22701 [Trichonephila inaurata madagascariensis]|uniref:Uncharacterized protein n=1 Tax=Trichonephila inaurata madagascariensis TaxID=2747483 RepID=A0A8X6YJB6_9ARAC|nr:hypothetical protein TNIN_22701 [Trichonephila inaurata madagascariensis]